MKNNNKVGNYLALTLSAGAAATSAEAATIVTLYGDGVTAPAGINVGEGSKSNRYADTNGNVTSDSFFSINGSSVTFTRGENLAATSTSLKGQYRFGTAGSFTNGAQAGAENYANISFNGNDAVYEAVGQFFFDEANGGYLIALAKNSDGSALSISAGKTAIDSAAVSAVPEPSSHLALLALGSVGLLHLFS